MSEPKTNDEIAEVEQTDAVAPDVKEDAPRDADDDVLDRLFADDSEEESVSAKPEKPVPSSKEREKAVAILKRDGVPDEILATVSEDTLKIWADKASKRQKDVDGFGKKMADLEKQLNGKAKPEPQDDSSDESDDVEVDVEPESSDTESDQQEDPFAEVEELLGADAAKPLKEMRAELAELRKQQSAAAEQSLLIQVDAADSYFRSQYGERSPERDAVIAEMNRLGTANPGTYKTVMHLAEEAYTNLAGKKAVKSDARKIGQPTAVRSVSRNERPRTPADSEDAILDALMDGKSRDEAMRLIRK
jgi:hypothetical protein